MAKVTVTPESISLDKATATKLAEIADEMKRLEATLLPAQSKIESARQKVRDLEEEIKQDGAKLATKREEWKKEIDDCPEELKAIFSSLFSNPIAVTAVPNPKPKGVSTSRPEGEAEWLQETVGTGIDKQKLLDAYRAKFANKRLRVDNRPELKDTDGKVTWIKK